MATTIIIIDHHIIISVSHNHVLSSSVIQIIVTSPLPSYHHTTTEWSRLACSIPASFSGCPEFNFSLEIGYPDRYSSWFSSASAGHASTVLQINSWQLPSALVFLHSTPYIVTFLGVHDQ
jgi:hypothetical protein